jgi:hypothetical protein
MSTQALAAETWSEANQSTLVAALAVVRCHLERHAAGTTTPQADAQLEAALRARDLATAAVEGPTALHALCATLNLSPFECDILLLCAAVEMDAAFPHLCAAAHGDAERAYPSFGLALAALPGAHWSALAPDAPLRRWRLIDVGAGGALTFVPLRIEERVLHYLAGIDGLDERLWGLLTPVPAPATLVPSHRILAQRIATVWGGATGSPIVVLRGDDAAAGEAVAATVCAELGLRLALLPGDLIPTGAAEVEALGRLWGREAALGAWALLVAGNDVDATDLPRLRTIARFVDRVAGPVFMVGRSGGLVARRSVIGFDVPRVAVAEQRGAWQRTLAAAGIEVNGQVEALVTQFDLGVTAIEEISREVAGLADEDPSEALWRTCQARTRPRLDDLALRLDPNASRDDLVLPDEALETLREVVAHVRKRILVYEGWGFANRGQRGLGVTALFSGVSGTGKTLAAEVVARELNLDLYRIDLSQVVSKYIGETEKNLRRIFDAAEEGGAVLLFDEADALFGKRSEVKDSHDRYANIEVSYLLQRMEAYRGLAILTTNMRTALDPAFLRRIRFVVQFPFPDTWQRMEIWRRIFPSETPVEGLDVAKLAQLSVAGGNIRNIALFGAFLAANEEEPVRMGHLLRAARREYAKLERTLTDTETRGWLNT